MVVEEKVCGPLSAGPLGVIKSPCSQGQGHGLHFEYYSMETTADKASGRRVVRLEHCFASFCGRPVPTWNSSNSQWLLLLAVPP